MGLACPLVVLLQQCRSILCFHLVNALSLWRFFHNSQLIPLSHRLVLMLYYFCSSFLPSLIMCLTVSSISPHNEYLLFSCVLLTFTLILLVIMALFCAVMRKGFSFSHLDFPFVAMSRYPRVQYRHFVARNIHTVIFYLIFTSSFSLFFYLYL